MGNDMQWYGEMEAARQARETRSAALDILAAARSTDSWGKIAEVVTDETLRWVQEQDEAMQRKSKQEKERAKRNKIATRAARKLTEAEREALGI